MIEFSFDDFDNTIKKTVFDKLSSKSLGKTIARAAEITVGEAQRMAPVQLGKLKNSSVVDRPVNVSSDTARVEFGFDAEYATIMDTGWKVRFIKPVRAKRLFIPISRRAIRAGGSREGFARYGQAFKFGRDFVFSKRAGPMPAPVAGRRRGPNLYFTRAINEKAKKAMIVSIGITLKKGP